MAVIDFRGHTFSFFKSGEGYYDNNGDFVPGQKSLSSPIYCNAVPNNGEAMVKNAEGVKTEYSFTLYCDASVKDFEFGEMISLNREGIVYELSVKGFHRYTRMVKIWV